MGLDLAWVWLNNPKKYIFWTIGNRAWRALMAGEYEKSRNLAIEWLKMAPEYPNSWHYNVAICNGHQILGLLDLREHNVPAAIEQLWLTNTGSEQILVSHPSFRFLLASKLVKAGEHQAVIKFLNDMRNHKAAKNCPAKYKVLVESMRQNRSVVLAAWIESLKEGNIPDDPQWR